jgi:hypothetical protein
MQLAFRQVGRPIEAALATRYGQIGLYIGQVCSAEKVGRRSYQLQTIAYKYTLTPAQADEPVFRWEYVRTRDDPDARWSRHHLQGSVDVDLGTGEEVSLNDLHVPTGWVTIEEILRFCIVDLGIAPLTEDWDRVLNESYERFKKEFSPMGSV